MHTGANSSILSVLPDTLRSQAADGSVAPPSEIVYIVDHEAQCLHPLLASAGYDVRAFMDPHEFLVSPRPDLPSCLILDLHLKRIPGLELQRQLLEEPLPVIFLTAHADVCSAVSAMKSGAVDFLSKPAEELQLLSAVRAALNRAEKQRRNHGLLGQVRRSYATLTPRERDVLPYIVRGFLNKQTAHELGTAEITVRIHRSHIMKKMIAASLADLIRFCAMLNIPGEA
jgi:FixJ family two-component response regulator